MSNTYFKAMSVMGCEIGGITRRNLCRHNCCDGENCVTWLEKQFAKLNEYEQAKAEERFVVLPCKVGDTVYIVYAKKILETTVDKRAWIDDDGYMLRTKEGWFKEKDIGKTVFLTRKEAEKALEVGIR